MTVEKHIKNKEDDSKTSVQSNSQNVDKTDQLKSLPSLLQSSKISYRKKGFELLNDFLNDEDECSETFKKGITILLVSLIPSYQDRSTQFLLLSTIKTLLTKFGTSLKTLVITLYSNQASECAKIVNTTPSLARYHFFHFDFGCKIWHFLNSLKVSLDVKEATSLVDALAVYYSLSLIPSNQKSIRRLNSSFNVVLMDSQNKELLSKILADGEASVHKFIFGSWISASLPNKDINSCLLQSYTKNVLLCKKKPGHFILERSSALLSQLSHDEFAQSLLPVAIKSLLRNPEVILEAVGHLFTKVNLDLSRYINDILKVFENPLHANEDRIREDAVVACEALAAKCQSPTAIRAFIKLLLDILTGVYGKLTVNSHKITILQALEKVSGHGVTDSKYAYELSEEVALGLLKILETETHEASLIQALTTLSSWAGAFVDNCPDAFIQFIPKGLNLKSSTTGVRTCYFRLVSACVTSSTANKFSVIIPSFLQMLDKALSQSAQVPYLTEALSICTLILKFGSCDSSLSPHVQSMRSSALDMKKSPFTSEKFVNQASPETLLQLVKWCEIMLTLFQTEMGAELQPVKSAVLWCLCCSSSPVRQAAREAVKDLCFSSSGGSALLVDLVSGMEEVVSRSLKEQIVSKDGAEKATTELCPVGVIQGLLLLCSNSEQVSEEAKNEIVCLSVKSVFHPLVVSERPDLWMVVCNSFGLQPPEVIANNKSTFVKFIKDNISQIELIRGLCRYGGRTIYPEIVRQITQHLDEPLLNEVTDTDMAIYGTPEGTLYDSTAVDEAFEKELNLVNVKKTDKTYSHQEQMLILEEKKKALQKKRREGKLDLTPKQKEVMNAELEKEVAVRQRIKDLDHKATKYIGMLEAAIDGDKDELGRHLKGLIIIVVKYLPSKLVGARLGALWNEMARSCFDSDQGLFGLAIGRTTLRLYDCAMEFPSDWCGETKEAACARILQEFHTMTAPKFDSEGNYLNAPCLVYSLPLLEWVVLKWKAQSPEKTKMDTWVVNVIKNHVVMRGNYSTSLYHPKFLDRVRLLKLLITVISTREGRVQQTACAVLEDVCLCSSGRPGCETATKEDIFILLDTLTAPAQSVRDASLRGLSVLINSNTNLSSNAEVWKKMRHHLFVARHDEDEGIAGVAAGLWEKSGMQVDKSLLESLLNDVIHPNAAIRLAAASALGELIEQKSASAESVVQKLMQIYRRKLEITPAKKDQYDREVEEAIDHWECRSGVAVALHSISKFLQEKSVIALSKFYVPEALGDRNEVVRKDMLNAALALVDNHGKESVNNLLPVFEKFLGSAPKHAKFDAVKQGVVVLMGALARHLDQSSPKIQPIVTKLVDSLNTPSQQVQESVAHCLYPLIPAVKEECPAIVSKLMGILLESNNYGQRKGASYGLASVVKGLGILSLKQLDIMNKLTQSIQDKKTNRYREGSLFAIEQLCNMLGKLFEPYIVHILPHLLVCFGDSSIHVRQAAEDTAKAVMSKLSAHGVKLVLPSLLAALEEESWRTKQGSIELLGNMAFCAPKQLSSCLPSIVPRLIDVLSDSHLKVQSAGVQALRLIGSVIRNPEIQAIVPVLLSALSEPGPNTSLCLQTLLETKFVHFIDSPSLALIMPVVERAFQDRSTEVRKMAAQIIGNMYSLTDQKDLAPYLPSIIPGLKASLLDPVPKVRSVSARALGAMVKGMGESSFDDLLPWLMQTLTSEASPVDRSGAAQGLAEVVGALGTEKLDRLMPDIVATAERSDIAPHVKDGYIMMFIFLPTVFEDEFTPYIGQIIPPILKALADENEFVRDTALRAGQRIVNTYASTAVTLLLPELEKGLFHDNWRIRFSSVQLLGDLLYRVSGVSGKMTTDTAHEDDNFGTEQSHKAIMRVLGEDRRNRVLAGLYMGRSDVALLVRQAALHVWKVVVTNTPKTLREILPTLFSLLLTCLASTSYDKRQVAARTLGDLVRKLGERVLPEIIPILEKGLDSTESDHRQGVCIGLSEIMASTSKDVVLFFSTNLVPTVRRALCDPLPEVREAAAHTFDSLHSTVGVKALDDILPDLLAQLKDETEESEFALDGLKQVMTVKSRVVLPYLIPQLTKPPVNTRALCILASVAGETLTKHLTKILPALLDALAHAPAGDDGPSAEYETILTDCQEVVLAVNDDMGVNTIVDELLSYSKNKNSDTARAAVSLLFSFCSNTRIDYSDYAPQLIRGLIQLLTSTDKTTLQTAWETLNAVTKSLDPADQRALVPDVRQAVKFVASDLKGQNLIPGFCLPKGIQPVLPIFREAVLNGEPDQKEAASNGLTEVIRLTSSAALKTSVVHITGPLIRILGDRFAWNVKVAVLDTLALLLEKAGPMLKPFLPQLQTTFVKAIHDPQRVVRLKAGSALSYLIVIHTKPDPLFTELHNSVKTAEDPLIRETMLQAVRYVVGPAGSRMSETVCKGLQSTLTSFLSHEVDSIRLCAAGALGALLPWLPESSLQNLVSNQIMGDSGNSDWRILHGKSSALFCALKSAPEKVLKHTTAEKVSNFLLTCLSSDKDELIHNSIVGVGFLLKYSIISKLAVHPPLLTAFAKAVNHPNNDIKQRMCQSSQYVAEKLQEEEGEVGVIPKDIAKPLIPMLVNGTKEKNPVVRSAAEMALIAILRLKTDPESTVESMLSILDVGAREALSETISKTLRKASYSPVTENEMDPSILT